MKVLNLGLDNSILNKDSNLAKRAIEYGNLVEKYFVVAPFKENKELELSDRAVACGVEASNKIKSLFNIYKLSKKIISENNIDVISVQDQYYLGLAAYLLAQKFNVGLEIQVHGFEKYYGLRKFIAKYILPRANSVRVVSQRLKKELVEKFGVKEEKITVVPIFVEHATHNLAYLPTGQAGRQAGTQHITLPTCLPDRQAGRQARNNSKFIFLTVGRLVPVKNIEMQINAIADIIKKSQITNYKSQIELWIIGEGAERIRLEKLCYELPAYRTGRRVTSYVKFFGWQDNLDEFYSQADAFLLTSNYEGWGLVVIEAATHSLPIIMTDVGCAGEVLKNKESGMIIPIGDKEKLDQAMVKLIEDENLRKKLGESAREAVKNLPSKEQTLNLYKKSWEMALKNNSL